MLKGALVAVERRLPTCVRFRFLFPFAGYSSHRHEVTSSHPSLRNSGAFTAIRVIHATESSQRYNLGIISGVRQKVSRFFVDAGCLVEMDPISAVFARYQKLG